MLKDIQSSKPTTKLASLMTEPAPVPLLAKSSADSSPSQHRSHSHHNSNIEAMMMMTTPLAPIKTTGSTTNRLSASNESTSPAITPALNMTGYRRGLTITPPPPPSMLLSIHECSNPLTSPPIPISNCSPNMNSSNNNNNNNNSNDGITPNNTTSIVNAQTTGRNVTAAANALQDHYSLRWNNHQNHILRSFDALLQTKTLVDVTLVCAETSIRAHKMVLSACSPFFQRVFAETPCKHPVIVLKDFRGWVVQAIVDFMYRGEISVPQERLQTLIQAGESLQVRGLVESSVPEHTPTPAASPEDFNMLETSLMSSELGRCSSFDESPTMVGQQNSKLIIPSRAFGAASSAMAALTPRRAKARALEREEREREFGDSDQEMQGTDLCTSPMPRRKQARPRRRSGEMTHDFQDLPESATISRDVPPTTSTNSELYSPPTASSTSTTNITTSHTSAATISEPLLSTPKSRVATFAAARIPSPLPTIADVQRELKDLQAKHMAAMQTVIKSELLEPVEDDTLDDDANDRGAGGQTDGNDLNGECDSGTGNDSREHNEPHEKSSNNLQNESDDRHKTKDELNATSDASYDDHFVSAEDLDNHSARSVDDNEEIMNNQTIDHCSKVLQSPCHYDGPEDLCMTKKDSSSVDLLASVSENESIAGNNNNSNKLKDNNQRIGLSLKDIRHLNKPRSNSTPYTNSNTPFGTAHLRDLRSERTRNSPSHMGAFEAQMQAAAAAAVAAANAGAENPFQHMEHQMDLSLAAAAAAVSHQHSRERDQAMREREHRELQQHNAFANSLLGPMGMPPFGPPSGGPNGPPMIGQAPHERLEESMNRLSKEFAKEFAPSPPMSLPPHFNPPDGTPHPQSPLSFPVFGLDSTLGLFPPGIDPSKLYNPLMEMNDPRDMQVGPPPFIKKKMPRPKGQHSAPRGGPPRSWTNTELTEALQHVWNKKMTTSQASRVFGIPYNSLLMYVRGKYGKSLRLEELRKDCISGPPLEMLQMGVATNSGSSKSEKQKERKEREKDRKEGGGGGAGGGISGTSNGPNGGGPSVLGHMDNGPTGLQLEMDLGLAMSGGPPLGPRSSSSEPDLLGGPNSLFNPFNPQGFYPDFPGGFPGLPLSMLNLLPSSERHQHAAAAAAMHHMSSISLDEDCKSDRSKQSSSLDDDFPGPLALSRDEHRRSTDMLSGTGGGGGGGNGGLNCSLAAPSNGTAMQD